MPEGKAHSEEFRGSRAMKASFNLCLGPMALCHSMVTGVTFWLDFAATQTWGLLSLSHSLPPFIGVREAEGGTNQEFRST